jgi:hypothetical protein
MGNTPFSKSSFEVSEEVWLETLSKVSSEKTPRTLWVSLRSRIVRLLATPFQFQVYGRAIHLLLPQQSPADPPQIEIVVFLPELGVGVYEKRTNEKGQIRLSMLYPATRYGDRLSREDFVYFVIATNEEFLTVPDSETLLQ